MSAPNSKSGTMSKATVSTSATNISTSLVSAEKANQWAYTTLNAHATALVDPIVMLSAFLEECATNTEAYTENIKPVVISKVSFSTKDSTTGVAKNILRGDIDIVHAKAMVSMLFKVQAKTLKNVDLKQLAIFSSVPIEGALGSDVKTKTTFNLIIEMINETKIILSGSTTKQSKEQIEIYDSLLQLCDDKQEYTDLLRYCHEVFLPLLILITEIINRLHTMIDETEAQNRNSKKAYSKISEFLNKELVKVIASNDALKNMCDDKDATTNVFLMCNKQLNVITEICDTFLVGYDAALRESLELLKGTTANNQAISIIRAQLGNPTANQRKKAAEYTSTLKKLQAAQVMNKKNSIIMQEIEQVSNPPNGVVINNPVPDWNNNVESRYLSAPWVKKMLFNKDNTVIVTTKDGGVVTLTPPPPKSDPEVLIYQYFNNMDATRLGYVIWNFKGNTISIAPRKYDPETGKVNIKDRSTNPKPFKIGENIG